MKKAEVENLESISNAEKSYQVKDDLSLLHKMWSEQLKADLIYRPGNYWENYSKVFMPELEKFGLLNFRRRNFSVLGSFGATDLDLFTLKSLPNWLENLKKRRVTWRYVPHIVKLIEYLLKPIRKIYEKQFSAYDIFNYFYPRISERFYKRGWNLKDFSMSLIGNPLEQIDYEGKKWSRHHLEMVAIFVEAMEKATFPSDGILLEIGPGIGRNCEFFATAYPDATILLFDVVPQLYVLNQYLKERFPNRFIDYENSRSLDLNTINNYKGKVILFPTWDIPKFRSLKINYFWNSASFQEMEPFIVENYLNIIKTMEPDYIYLNQLPGGNYWGEWKPGRGGTKAPVKDEIYEAILTPVYRCIERYPTNYLMRKPDYCSYIYKRET